MSETDAAHLLRRACATDLCVAPGHCARAGRVGATAAWLIACVFATPLWPVAQGNSLLRDAALLVSAAI